MQYTDQVGQVGARSAMIYWHVDNAEPSSIVVLCRGGLCGHEISPTLVHVPSSQRAGHAIRHGRNMER